MYIQEINYHCFVDGETIASISTTFFDVLTIFSLNFSPVGKGPLILWLVRQKIFTRGALSRGEGGIGVRDMAPPSQGNLGAKFSETSFPHVKTYFTQIGRCYLKTII